MYTQIQFYQNALAYFVVAISFVRKMFASKAGSYLRVEHLKDASLRQAPGIIHKDFTRESTLLAN
jgi:hypothetical protein